MKNLNLKSILPVALVALFISSCTVTEQDKVDEPKEGIVNEKTMTQEPIVKKGTVTFLNSLTDDGLENPGIELTLNDGSYFLAEDESKIKLEGIKKLAELKEEDKVEITYILFPKEETTQFAKAAGAEGLYAEFIKKVDGLKNEKELDLISYELKTEGSKTTCTIKAKDEKGKTFEFKSDLNALDRKGVFENNFGLTAKSIAVIGKTSFYKKEEKWETVEGVESGYTRLTLLKEDSKTAKIVITDILYYLKDIQKIKVVK